MLAVAREVSVAPVAQRSGTRFETLRDQLLAAGHPLSGGIEDPLHRVRAGHDPGHPRACLLRWKGAASVTEHPAGDWMDSRDAIDRLCEPWRAGQELLQWLTDNISPSSAEPVK